MVKRAALVVLSLLAAGSLLAAAGCNTVKGAGEDLKSAGEAGERAIDRATR